jgi:vacuolar-type H+-ATPase subunit H
MSDDAARRDGQERGLEEERERDFERRVARRKPGGDVEALLRELHETIDQARPAPLSTAVKVDRDIALDLLDQAIARLPDDLRNARWLLKERDEFLARTHREADEILAAARGQAERMVQRSEVLRSAEGKARRIVEVARTDAARIRNECDDYVDQRLAKLEAVLERAMGVIAAGRERLRPAKEGPKPTFEGSSEPNGAGDDGADGDAELSPAFFDQDRA